jgi:hypothetical protein
MRVVRQLLIISVWMHAMHLPLMFHQVLQFWINAVDLSFYLLITFFLSFHHTVQVQSGLLVIMLKPMWMLGLYLQRLPVSLNLFLNTGWHVMHHHYLWDTCQM